MTVAQLRERMDARKMVGRRFDAVEKRFEAVDERFDRLTARMDAGFSSMHDTLNAIVRALTATDDCQQQILTEHGNRLRDLEGLRLAHQDTAR